MRVPLIGDEHVYKIAAEQLLVEFVVSFLQPRILDRCDRDWLIQFSFVRSTRSYTLRHASLPLTIEGATAAQRVAATARGMGWGYRRSLVLKSTRVRCPQHAAGRQCTDAKR